VVRAELRRVSVVLALVLAWQGLAAEAVKGEEKKVEEKPKPFDQRMREAKAEALKNIKAGVDNALARHPKISADLKNALRNSSTHESWIEQTRTQARLALAKMKDVSPEFKQNAEINAVRDAWSEARTEQWMEVTLVSKEQQDESRAKTTTKKKDSGIGGVAPGGTVIQGGVGGTVIGQ
jgi:hypothetical protein